MIILREKGVLEHVSADLPMGIGKLAPKSVKKIGFAVDIGTTTVEIAGVAFLKEASQPTEEGGAASTVVFLGKKSALNVQRKLGKDVMMRIMHAVSGKQQELQKLIVEQVEGMAAELLGELSFDGIETEFVIVGNTTMCHLFLGEPVEGLKGAPFQMAYEGNRVIRGKGIGCRIWKDAMFFVLSGIASHVGSDALSVLCETGMYQKGQNILAVDLGTNAEILLNKSGELWCCSAAAGPAFEGRGVSAGRTAGEGVITGVKLAAHTGNMILEYIKGKEVFGICGSGLIDLLAELKNVGLLTDDGYLLSKEEAEGRKGLEKWQVFLTDGEKGERSFLVYKGRKNIYLTQEDIRTLQLAKGAIGAAVSVLLKEVGLPAGDLDTVILAGVLGSNIKISHAMELGLIPNVDRNQVMLAGNAALDGAIHLVMDGTKKEEWEKIAKKVNHLELAGREDFSAFFIKSMRIDSIV